MNAAYLAGFFDGEGYVGIVSSGCSPRLALSQKNREVLDRIAEFIGHGTVYATKKGHWHLRIHGRDNVRRMVKLMKPYSVVKRRQLELMERFLAIPKWSRDQQTKDRLRDELKVLNHKLDEDYIPRGKRK